jgi:hypothetical protein
MKSSVWFNICVKVNTSCHSETINSKSRSDVRWEHPPSLQASETAWMPTSLVSNLLSSSCSWG